MNKDKRLLGLKRAPRWWERAIDGFVHAELLFLKLPYLFLNPLARRRRDWPDAADKEGSIEPEPPAQAALVRGVP